MSDNKSKNRLQANFIKFSEGLSYDFCNSLPYQGNTYDGYWVSTKSSTPGNYPDGIPAGYELMFENGPRPIRFASIDIVVEQEVGDIYELVTSNDEVVAGKNYILVNRKTATDTQGRAFSVNQYNNSTSGNFLSTPVQLLENGRLVKTTGDVLIMKLEDSGDEEYSFCIKAVGGYLRTETQAYSSDPESYRISRTTSKPSNTAYVNTKININTTGIATNWGYFAQIGFQQWSFNKRIYHYNSYNQFRTLNTSWASTENRVYLYKPSEKLLVTTEVQPEAPQGETPYGTISLRDGILVENNMNWSQKMDTVQFLVTPKDGYKIKNITVQQVERDKENNYEITEVKGTVNILNISPSINGTLYTFVMPELGAHIIAEFEKVKYYDIKTVVLPSGDYGNIFLTEGYVVQGNQVKSYGGENVVFNVTPNFKDIEDESQGYHQLYSVKITYTDDETGQDISYTLTDGNYSFTMPEANVTITATFIYDNGNPLYLLGTANGGEFLPYGPRFNYDTTNEEYYIDVYFKGTDDYSEYTGGDLPDKAYGHFCVVWGKWETWGEVNQQTRRGMPYEDHYLISTENPQYTLCYDDNKANQGYSFKIQAGIYRIYVKSYGYHNDVLRIEKFPTTLTLDPAGGESAASAVEVPQNQLVVLSGDLYNKIKAINPDEADGNFMYKATKTIDGNATSENESAGANTTNISKLTVVNDGETVTQLDGTNYLGWIHADKTAYFKVIRTPLGWIEKNGEKDKTYTIADQLQGVYVPSHRPTSLWCKDLGNISIIKTTPSEGQDDYFANRLSADGHIYPMRYKDWDQSNWVELDFSGYGETEGVRMAAAGKDKLIDGASVTGVYTDDLNYKIKVTSGELSTGDNASYTPNPYATVNFLESSLGANGVTIGEGDDAKSYYFLNPKIQEYAVITYAMWDKDNQIFVIPNDNPFSGAFKLGTWELNEFNDQSTQLDGAYEENPNREYEFHAIIQRTSKDYGTPVAASQGAPALRDVSAKTGQEAWDVFTIIPLDLRSDYTLPTAIHGVTTQAQVASIEYVNIAGMRSSKPFKGVNIVVTRYSDGSFTTSKVVK